MLKKLSLSNFKAWSGITRVELAPVTLFLGTNSTGKSSLIQSLLMLKQTVLSADRSVHLNLGGDVNDFVDLGRFDDIHSKDATNKHIGVGLRLDLGKSKQMIALEVLYGRTAQDVPYVDHLVMEQGEWQVKVKRGAKGTYQIELPSSDPLVKLGPKRSYSPERAIFLPTEVIRSLGGEGGRIDDVSLAIQNMLSDISYLGPLRQKPERYYTWNKNKPEAIGQDGSQAIPALLASAQNNDGVNLVKEISKWLKRMGVADKLVVKRIGTSTQYSILVHRDGVVANLLDVGVGISQVLPVLTLGYFAKEGSLIILEEPEIHLHPLAQSILAEYFVEVSKKRNVQFVVETHSEHLFRRLQTLMARQEITQDDCRMYFIERDKQAAKLRELTTDEFGRVQNWPDHFFGDAMGELREQATLMTERLEKQYGNKN